MNRHFEGTNHKMHVVEWQHFGLGEGADAGSAIQADGVRLPKRYRA